MIIFIDKNSAEDDQDQDDFMPQIQFYFLIRGVLQWWNEQLELNPAKKFTGNMARKTFATMGVRYASFISGEQLQFPYVARHCVLESRRDF